MDQLPDKEVRGRQVCGKRPGLRLQVGASLGCVAQDGHRAGAVWAQEAGRDRVLQDGAGRTEQRTRAGPRPRQRGKFWGLGEGWGAELDMGGEEHDRQARMGPG